MGAGASALAPNEQERLQQQQQELAEKVGISKLGKEKQEAFKQQVEEVYAAHGGNAIFTESAQRQAEIWSQVEKATAEKFKEMGLDDAAAASTNEFRKRRLSYSIEHSTIDHAQHIASLQVESQSGSRRPSLNFRSPPLQPVQIATASLGSSTQIKRTGSNRRLKLKPALEDVNNCGKVQVNTTEDPPFDENTLGTYSHHGIEPKYIGQGFTCKINQDRGCVVYPFRNSAESSLYCVFDGHGEHGEDVSEFTVESIVEKLENDPDLLTSPEHALTKAFLNTNDDLTKSDIDSYFSGTTAVAVYRTGNVLYAANAGDSRAVLCQLDPTTKTLSPVPLTIDHNPDSPAERERITAAGGFVSDPPGEGLSARVWLDRNMTRVGLAMARSIGDNAVKKVGVIAEPEVRKHTITTHDLFMILASDGVWEFISSQEAIQLVYESLQQTKSASAACKLLIERSIQCWKENEGDYRDDITAIVMRINRYDEN